MSFATRFTIGIDGDPQFHLEYHNDYNPLSGNYKRRRLCKPNQAMRQVHNRFLRFLRTEVMVSLQSTDRRISPTEHIHKHRRSSKHQGRYFPRYFYHLDLSSAYGSVNPEILAEVISEYTVTSEVSEKDAHAFLERFCISPEGGLATGAPSSPDLFNMYVEVVLDRGLRTLSEKYSIRYSRYLDDLLFSAVKIPVGKRKRRAIRELVLEAGFSISHHKTHVYDLAKGPVVINGVGVRRDGRTFLPRKRLRRLRGLLHSALHGKDIDPAVIHGEMGLFKSTTSGELNATERKISRMYSTFVQLQQT